MNALPLTSSALALLVQEAPVAAADDTGRTITLVIGALLGLALLLAVLTLWYWRRTDPRRAAAAEPVRISPVSRPAGARSTAAVGARGGAEGTAADRGISTEEWLRLTGARQPTRQDPT